MTTPAKKKLPAKTFGAVILTATIFTPMWEGMDTVARKDLYGTGHPVTYCYGQTSEFGKVKEGTRFTKKECDEKLAQSLPTYLDPIVQCVKVDLPVKVWGSLLDAAYNAGPGRVCASPMVKRMNAGDIKGGCDAFDGWIVRGDGKVLKGLILRRAGEIHGDKRKSERALCLEGLKESKTTVSTATKVLSLWDRFWAWLRGK